MFPKVVDLEITAYCNLSCGFCFGPEAQNGYSDLPTSFWMRVLEWIKDYGASGIVISGGEPTLHPDIIPLLEFAKYLNLSVVMSTNGRLYDRIIQCIPFLDWIAFPVDGVTKDTLKVMRGNVWGINELKIIVDEIKTINNCIDIKIGTVASKKNQHEIIDIGQEIDRTSIAISTWKIYQYTPRRKFSARKDEFYLSDASFMSLTKRVNDLIQKNKFDIVFSGINSRNRAYLFVYPDGSLIIPKTEENVKDLVIGNLYIEGKTILDKVQDVDIKKHETNFNSTYPKNN